MPVDKRHWGETVPSFNWLCGRCQRGHLRRSAENWSEALTADTRRGQSGDEWEPDWDEYRFAGLLLCDNPECRDPVSVGGLVSYEHFQTGPSTYEHVGTYRVQTVAPPPCPFPISELVPSGVSERLRSAAGLLWSDHDASANKIRQAVEFLLDERRVKKFPRSGARKAVPLHQRIQTYSATNSLAAAPLLAIKWIGNAGSHTGGLSREDVLDALDLMEVALEEVYVGHRRAIMKKVKRINNTGKPLGARKRR
jgi:hypothetical protein